MEEPNYAGNIIVNLAGLPDFLRRPILAKRLREFFAMTEQEQAELVCTALEAGPDIPFARCAKLCKTWLEILATMDYAERTVMFSAYLRQIAIHPESIIRFNLDGILEIFMSLDGDQRGAIGASVMRAVESLDAPQKRLVLKLMPDNAKRVIMT